MRRKGIYLFALLMLVAGTSATIPPRKSPEAVTINWLTFEQAVEKMKTEPRKIFIDVYTDWCGYCKVMDKNTFTDPIIAGLINEHFYAVKLDAEQKQDIRFRDVTFKYVSTGRGGYHELAASLLNNKLSYPNFVFLTPDFKIVSLVEGYTSLPGYRKPEEFHFFLSFVAGDHWQKMQLSEYQKVYKSPYPVAAN